MNHLAYNIRSRLHHGTHYNYWWGRHDGETIAVNLGNRRGISVRQVIDIVRHVSGREVIARDAPRRPGDPSVLVADPKKSRELLGWTGERSDLATIVADAWRWHAKRFGLKSV